MYSVNFTVRQEDPEGGQGSTLTLTADTDNQTALGPIVQQLLALMGWTGGPGPMPAAGPNQPGGRPAARG